MENIYGIKVGTPATFGCWTDSYPAVVTSVTSKTVTIQEVRVGANREFWPGQDFEVFLDKPFGSPITFRNINGIWKSGSYRIGFGTARYYRDPSF